jgi:phosphoribosylcarboxyaminoimidazole (NCAIR) mutase
MAQQEIRDVVFNVQVRTEDGKVKIEGLTKSFVNADTAFKRMKTALDQTNDALNKGAISTGLANTAVLEFGRTLSDAPYGIQGVGNNITQLVTLMGQMSQQAKETGGSIKDAFKTALLGPLGVVVVVQFAIAAFEIFRKSQEGVTKETNKLAESQARAASSLKIAKDALLDESVALQEKQEIIDALNEEYPKWNLSLSESGAISEENVAKIDAEIMALERLAKAKAYQNAIEDLYAEKAQLTSDYITKQGTLTNELTNAILGYGNTVVGANIQLNKFTGELGNIDDKIKVLGEAMKGEGLIDLILGSDKDGKPKKESRDKIKKLVTETYDLSIVEAAKYKKDVEKRAKDLGVDYASIILGGEEGKKALGEGILGLIDGLRETGYSDRIKETMRKAVFAEDILDGAEALLDATSGLVAAQAERDLAIETNKTNALNDQLKARLANEQLSAQERDKINQQIARNEAELVRKENEINKKRFEQQKALQLASATAELYRTAFLAYGSQLVIGDPTSPIRAQIAQGIALAAGIANIAMIAKQKFTGKAMPAPNLTAQGGGGPAEAQGPAFNIVGAGGQSQLAQAIAAQQREPVRAYVVAGEVTTAQSLERNKIKEASI